MSYRCEADHPAVHGQGVIHRDIKPDNLLLSDDDVLKVVDFGVSQMFGKPDDMRTAKSAGSPAFLPPELCGKHGDVEGAPIDIWSMGVSLYCMKYGKIPFNRDSMMEMYEAIKTDAPYLPDDENPDLVDLFHKILEKDPKKRITMTELRVSNTAHVFADSNTQALTYIRRSIRGSPRGERTHSCPPKRIVRSQSSRPTSSRSAGRLRVR